MKINKYSVTFTIFSIILITFIIYNTLCSKKNIESYSNISSTPTLLDDGNYNTSTPDLWDKNKTNPLIGGQKFYNVNITIKDGDALVDSVGSPGSTLAGAGAGTGAGVGAGAGAGTGSGAGADNETSLNNWELYSNKTYIYTGGDIQDDINNSYNCRKRCNTNSDGTENKECKAYFFNQSNSVTVKGDTNDSNKVTLNFQKLLNNNMTVTGTGIKPDTFVVSHSNGNEVTLSQPATIKNNTLITFGGSCKLINSNDITSNSNLVEASKDNLFDHEDDNGGVIYKKTNVYQHISTDSTGSIKPMDFGNFSNLVKCKNLEGTTVCEGEACKNYVPNEVITCASQSGESSTSSNQYDCERDDTGNCINKYEIARKEAERLAEIERKIKQEAEILAQKEKAAKNEAQRLAAKKEKEQKEAQAREAEKKRKAAEEAAEKLRQEEEEEEDAKKEQARVLAAKRKAEEDARVLAANRKAEEDARVLAAKRKAEEDARVLAANSKALAAAAAKTRERKAKKAEAVKKMAAAAKKMAAAAKKREAAAAAKKREAAAAAAERMAQKRQQKLAKIRKKCLRTVKVKRLDSRGGWGMNLNFKCGNSPVSIGPSKANGATTTAVVDLRCPRQVNKSNWLMRPLHPSHKNVDDRFATAVSGCYPEGTPIQCYKNDVGSGRNVAVYRYMGGTELRHYPNPSIASSWDADWGSTFKKIDCRGLKQGAAMPMNT